MRDQKKASKWTRLLLEDIMRNYGRYQRASSRDDSLLDSENKARRIKAHFDDALDSIGPMRWLFVDADSPDIIRGAFKYLNKGQKAVVALYLGYDDAKLKNMGIPDPANTRAKAFSMMVKYLDNNAPLMPKSRGAYLTTRQVALKLGISDMRVRKLIYEGRIKSVKIGGHNLIEEEDAHYERKRNYPAKSKTKKGTAKSTSDK